MEYTNSQLVEFTQLSPYNSGRRTHAIDRITPHCVVGQITAKALGEWFSGNNRQASSNYGIGLNGEVGMYCPESVRSWCSSSPENDQRAVTIECASDKTHPYAFRDVVYQRLVALCADICRRNGKTKLLWIPDKAKALAYQPAEDEMLLTVHRWFLDTVCPGEWLMQRMGDLAEQVTALLVANEGTTGEVAEDNNVPSKQDNPEVSAEDADDGPEAVTPPADPAGQEPAPPPDQAKPTGTQARDLAKLTQRQIVDAVGPLFTQEQRRTGILASVAMAQFLLECGYCQSPLAQEANNCFGMKCYLSGNTWPGSVWDGESRYVMTAQEQNPDGTWFSYSEAFRAYLDIETSIADHSAYLLGAMNGDAPRYAGLAGCTDCRKAVQIIKDGGYATGLSYVNDLLGVIDLWDLTRWDLPQEQSAPIIPDPSPDVVMIPRGDWNAIRAAVSILHQAVKKYEGGDSNG